MQTSGSPSHVSARAQRSSALSPRIQSLMEPFIWASMGFTDGIKLILVVVLDNINPQCDAAAAMTQQPAVWAGGGLPPWALCCSAAGCVEADRDRWRSGLVTTRTSATPAAAPPPAITSTERGVISHHTAQRFSSHKTWVKWFWSHRDLQLLYWVGFTLLVSCIADDISWPS